MKEIKAVIDTNVLVGILKGASGTSLIYAAFKAGDFKLVINSGVLKELAAVLYRPTLNIGSADIKELFRLIRAKALRIRPRTQLNDACRDPKDNFILELALDAKADVIVTRDKDLLVLKSFRGIPIVKPREFLNQLRK